MKRFSVLALLIAAAVGFTYALAYAAPSVSGSQAKSACGCIDCRCPDCNGEFCTCDECACGDCACLKAGGTKSAATQVVAPAPAKSCCTVALRAAAKQTVKAGCGCDVCQCPDCNGEFCTCETCECVGCGCAQ